MAARSQVRTESTPFSTADFLNRRYDRWSSPSGLCKCCCMFFPRSVIKYLIYESAQSYSIVRSNLRNFTRKARYWRTWARIYGKRSHPRFPESKARQSLDRLYQYCLLIRQKYRSCFPRRHIGVSYLYENKRGNRNKNVRREQGTNCKHRHR